MTKYLIKNLRILTGAFIALLTTGLEPAFAQTTLQILHASDLEGGVDAVKDAPNFAAVVESLETDATTHGYDSIILSAGDNYIPGPFFGAAGDRSLRDIFQTVYQNFFDERALTNVRESPGRADITIMNLIGFDASALGNHEFDAGTSTIESIIGSDIRGATLGDVRWLGAQFPYLSSNLDFSGDGELSDLFTTDVLESTEFISTPSDLTAATNTPKLAPATIIVRGAENYGVIGVTTPLLATISSPGLTTILEPGAGTNDMAALASIVQPVVDAMTSAGINKIIVVSHLQQIALEKELLGLLENVDIIIAGGSDTLQADGTDILRSGDVADETYPYIGSDKNGTPGAIVSTDGEYSYVGRLVVDFDATGVIDPLSIDPIVNGAYATDDSGVISLWGDLVAPFTPGTKGAAVKVVADAVAAVVNAKDGIVYGKTAVFIEGRRNFVRTEETNMGNLTADANLTKAQSIDPSVLLSFKNGGGIRAEIGSIDGTTGELLPTEANPSAGKLAGDISQLDIENTLRFNNTLKLVTLPAQSLIDILEHGVADSHPGNTPGRFPQISGLSFSFDPLAPVGRRVVTAAIKDLEGNTLDVLLEDGILQGDPTRPIRLVTLNFLVDFMGDGYDFLTTGTDIIDLIDSLGVVGEQQALAEYLIANYSVEPFDIAETAVGQDSRIQNLLFRSDSVAWPPVVPKKSAIQLVKIGSYATGIFDEGAAEITAFDAASQRTFVVNANSATVDILDMSDVTSPTPIGQIDIQALFGSEDVETSPNSVAVSYGLVAVAVQRNATDELETPLKGIVAFFDVDGNLLTTAIAGFLPDMITFTPDSRYVLVANEGEPTDDYSIDPEGSVSILLMRPTYFSLLINRWLERFGRPSRPIRSPFVRTASFDAFNDSEKKLRKDGVRIFGPGASVAQDLEPEYITVSGDSKTAFVALQENNALAIIDIPSATVKSIDAFGLKDWNQSALDPSNRDDTINIQPWPVLGMYQPDAIASFDKNGNTFILTANEGDARDYDGFSEEERGNDLTLDPTIFPDAADLQEDEQLGRINVTTAAGDTDGDGDFDEIHTYGARSFSIWKVKKNVDKIKLLYDSGSEFECITASLIPADFNSTNDENGSFDNRSDDKGPEPEGIAVGKVNDRNYAFIGLERVGGIMVYDITKHKNPVFVQYINTRDFNGDAEAGTAGDLAPEGIEFIPATDSPTGTPLLVVAYEVSGTVAIFEIQ
ncbi:MAG: choice-of-anchor I family protein [Verrucomicrobiota bacterium]